MLQRTDFPLDYSLYFDAEVKDIESWYVARFLTFRNRAFRQPGAYFERFAHLDDATAEKTAKELWKNINLVNLIEHIAPSQSKADAIIFKQRNHKIQRISIDLNES